MTEPSEQELLEAVKESLVRDGKLSKFKAELRAAVMGVLSGRSNSQSQNQNGLSQNGAGGNGADTQIRNPHHTQNSPPPTVPEETLILNELIREYLDWNGYRYSEQILVAESGQSNEKMKREILSSKLGVLDDSRTSKIPLLYFVIADFQKKD